MHGATIMKTATLTSRWSSAIRPPDRYPWDLLHRLMDVAYGVDFSRDFDVHLSPRPIFERQLQETAATRNPEFYQNILQDGIEWVGGGLHAG